MKKSLGLIFFTLLSLLAYSQPISVSRFHHSDGINGRHFYTTTPNELNGCNCGSWSQERGLGLLYPFTNNPIDSRYKPVYRFNKNGTHFYSNEMSAPEGFVYENILGYYYTDYIFLDYAVNTYYKLVPVEEYLSYYGDYLYTENKYLENLAGFTFQRIAFYVWVPKIN